MKKLMKTIIMFTIFMLVINLDQRLLNYIQNKVSETYDYKLTTFVYLFRVVLYSLIGFLITYTSRSSLVKYRWGDIHLNIRWLMPRLLPVLLLVCLYSPVGYYINLPGIRWFFSIHARFSSFELPRTILSLFIGYLFCLGIQSK